MVSVGQITPSPSLSKNSQCCCKPKGMKQLISTSLQIWFYPTVWCLWCAAHPISVVPFGCWYEIARFARAVTVNLREFDLSNQYGLVHTSMNCPALRFSSSCIKGFPSTVIGTSGTDVIIVRSFALLFAIALSLPWREFSDEFVTAMSKSSIQKCKFLGYLEDSWYIHQE